MGPIEAWWCPECRRAFAGGLSSACISQHPIEPCVVLPGLTPAGWDALMVLVSAAYDFEEATQRREQRLAELHVIHAVRALPPAILAAAREGR